MKTLASLLLISATVAGTAAQAQDVQANALTREQVVAELQAARAAGELSVGEIDYPPAIAPAESLTRAQVVAELDAARAAGQISVGELDYPPAVSQTSSVSREQVVAELRAARAAGQISVGELDQTAFDPAAGSHG